MKEVTVNLYKFNELSDDAQRKVVERKRIEIGNWHNEICSEDYWATIKKFQELTETSVEFSNYGGISIKFHHGDFDTCNKYGELDWCEPRELSGKLLFRYIDNHIFPQLFKGKYLSARRYNKNKSLSKRSKLCRYDILGDCPLTGTSCDYDILKPLVEYYRNWARPEYKDVTYDAIIRRCYYAFRNAWQDDEDYSYTDEFIRQELSENPCYENDYYIADGTDYNGPYAYVA